MPSSRRKHPAAADAIPTTWTSYPKDAPPRSPFMAQAATESSAARRVDNTHSSVPIVGVDSRHSSLGRQSENTLESQRSQRAHASIAIRPS